MGLHIVKAPVAKVSIGGAGNSVARVLRQGDVVPEGVSEDSLSRLVERGILEAVAVEESQRETVEIPEGDPSEEWSGKQLDALAKAEGVEFGPAKTKADKVAAIVAARKAAAEAAANAGS